MQSETKIDTNLYSRQMAVYGAEAMGKLITLKVFIHGLRGVGIETAKNLVLAGPGEILLHDDEIAQQSDRSVNFYIKDSDINTQTRADASLDQLRQLNGHVKVNVHKGAITTDILAKQNIVVITDFYDRQQLIEWNEFCRSKGIGFIYTGNLGLYGFAFVDFGDKHTILDKDGEEVKSAIVSLISQEEKGLVTVHDGKRHGFEDGDLVTFREVQGMEEVNGQVYKIEVKSAFSFTIDVDTRGFKAYTREGTVEQKKAHIHVKFRSLKDSLINPIPEGHTDGMYLCDWEKIGYPEQLHLTFNAVLKFAELNKQLPELNNEQHATQLVDLVKQINDSNKQMDIEGAIKLDEVNEGLIKNVARFARANISPVGSFWGGIIAQEVVKFTGKFTPLKQWLHYESFEALPETDVNRTRVGGRYDDMISIFGQQLVEKLSNSKTFMIGAGALGCEYLKLFALIGLGAGDKGKVTVTDDDNIEVSNLNRQFLFRPNNVGHSKSECAGKAVVVFNKDLKVHSIKNRVAPETEQLFNDDFWNGQDFIVNAVDNVKARLFVDSQCVWYGKPLFESGTLGTKCNSQIVWPKETQSYGDSVDPPEESIPLCTLKNFPNQIEHTIQWARDKFEGYFAEAYGQLKGYIESKGKWLQKTKDDFEEKRAGGILGPIRLALESVKSLSRVYEAGSYDKCIELARNIFQDFHYNEIAKLLHAYPLDHLTTEGLPFWSGPKRPPTAIVFDSSDPIHLNFIQATANIYAFMFGLSYNTDRDYIKKVVDNIKVAPFVPTKVAIKADDKDTIVEKSEDDEPVILGLLKELEALQIKGAVELRAIEFEKDDPTNWHIDFVGAVANLRARNYLIPEVDNFKVKLIAGKIIPALATTTAMVVGAVGLEIIKGVLGKSISKMKNSFMNLALPLWLFSEPIPPTKTKDKGYDVISMTSSKAVPSGWTTWDSISVTGPLTVKGLVEYFDKNFQVELTDLTYDKYILYSNWKKEHASRVDKDIGKLIEELSQEALPAWKRYIKLAVGASIPNQEDEVAADMPHIKFAFRG